MARKKASQQPKSRTLSAADLRRAIRVIERRVSDLESFDISSIEERWDAKVEALATKVNDSLSDTFGRGTTEYNVHYVDTLDTTPLVVRFPGDTGPPIGEIRQNYAKGISDTVVKLRSLQDSLEEKLEDIALDEESQVHGHESEIAPDNRRVFVVHGHDTELKEATARLLSKLELDPIILHEQPSKGRTIIEKLEAHVDVGFAVVLLTPEDFGYPADKPEAGQGRARQNVVMELGLFTGVLGRHRVCALHKGDVELPSDIDGVVYVRVDEGKGWRMELAREIKAAGITVDMNKLF